MRTLLHYHSFVGLILIVLLRVEGEMDGNGGCATCSHSIAECCLHDSNAARFVSNAYTAAVVRATGFHSVATCGEAGWMAMMITRLVLTVSRSFVCTIVT